MMAIPQVSLEGVRQTVNTGISAKQTVWNVRSGLNVAALNCLQPRHAALVDNYKTFLNKHSRELRSTNDALAREYRNAHGSRYRDAQDTYMTQVYNYFALPPALPRFCDAALEISHEAVLVQPGQLEGFAYSALPKMEAVFESFFQAYEQYRANVAAWDARYGTPAYGTQTSGGTATLDARYGTSGAGGITSYAPPASTASGATYGPTIETESTLTAPVNLGNQPQVQYVQGTGGNAPASGSSPQFVSQPVVQAEEESGDDGEG